MSQIVNGSTVVRATDNSRRHGLWVQLSVCLDCF